VIKYIIESSGLVTLLSALNTIGKITACAVMTNFVPFLVNYYPSRNDRLNSKNQENKFELLL